MKGTVSSAGERKDRPAATREARKQQMISKAWRLAEKKLDDGTASCQLISDIMKMGSEKEALDLRQREADIALKEAKVDAIKSASEIKEMFEDAMEMFKRYHGDDEDASDL